MDRRPATSRSSEPPEWWWIFDPRMSLRARVALIAAGSAALFSVLAVTLATRTLQERLERQLGGTFETLASQLSDKLGRHLHERFREVQFVAQLANVRAEEPATARRRVLENVIEASPDFAWLGFADASGRVTAGTGGFLEGTNVEDRPWFRGAHDKPFTGRPREFAALAQHARDPDDGGSPRFIDFAVPVTGLDGRFLGVLGAQVRCGAWMREVLVSVVPEAARRQRLGATVYGADGEVLLDTGSSGWTLPPDAPALPDRRRSRGWMVENTTGGTVYLSGFVRDLGFRDYRGLGGIVVVRQPVDDAFGPVRELRQTLTRWGLLATLAAAVGGWVIAGPFARRLHTIGRAAERIRQGDILTVLPRPTGRGELARMCGALGDMVDELRAKQDAADRPSDPANTRR